MDITLFNFLSTIIPISDALSGRLNSIVRNAQFKKKTLLLREGQLSNHIYFIESGLIRLYYLKEGREVCSGLICEGGMVVAVKSFFNREKSDEFIETIEDTRVEFITYDELERLYKDFPEFNIVGRKLITEYYVMSEERNFLLRKQTASGKYQFFQKRFGHLTSGVPRKDIASYLGINLETLSRLGT
jgi:CRP/FNR family transcriptional regulator, anaerobic regulatory protein